ncbi:serine/threonine-protein kinase SBK1-like [Acanthaster planci]|uniref:Serine/threonine-protein kinase SBK1-like n=1 Tax=Acanthaster planci TaxID=133434 RepID=A0A8B7YQ01_ACAPL|nr:serine/threonine-protein kinase SBK1-like [Acanthaster planci]
MDPTHANTMKQEEQSLPRQARDTPEASPAEDALSCPGNFIAIRLLSRGTFSKVELVVEKTTGKRVVLKYHNKLRIRMAEYLREFQTSCRLIHPAILVTYDQPIETDKAFIIVQEYAAQGDLLEAITPQQGLDEERAKSCLSQTASALTFMHKRLLVHGNVKPENILVFDTNMTIVKLSNFRDTQRRGDTMTKRAPTSPYTAPEISSTVVNEGYTTDYSQDIWAFGVVAFCVLTGVFPWGTATTEDTSFRNFTQWQKRRANLAPLEWRKLSSKIQKFLKKILDPIAERRCPVDEINKYLREQWLKAQPDQANPKEGDGSGDESPRAGDVTAMKELRLMLESHGVVTCSDSSLKRQRIDEWVQAACQQPADASKTQSASAW